VSLHLWAAVESGYIKALRTVNLGRLKRWAYVIECRTFSPYTSKLSNYRKLYWIGGLQLAGYLFIYFYIEKIRKYFLINK